MKVMFWSILGGVAITLLTGLLSNTPEPWVGATLYGYPMSWLTRLILAPEYFPWRVAWSGLAVDLVAWTVAIGAVLFGLTKAKK